MPFKIFAAPGDTRDDFKLVESQVNEWNEKHGAKIVSFQTTVNEIAKQREAGQYMMTIVLHYEQNA